MARWGEGDPRWICEERPDATNVNNWHWVEKNATPWSQNRLKELLLKQTLVEGPVKIVFNEFKKLEGEASANNRKAKLIFFFEWNIVIDFEATLAGSEIVYKGTVEILNLSDENEAREIQISSQVSNPGPHENQVLHLLNTKGLIIIREQLEKYISELKIEFSQGLILPNDKGTIRSQAVTTMENKASVNKKEFQNNVIVDKKQNTSEKASDTVASTTEFELTHCFKVSPDRLFDILTEPSLVSVWCPNSSIDAREGGIFSLLGGFIEGSFISLIKDKQISMKWRLKNYPPGVHANVSHVLNDKGDSVELQLKAEGVPEYAAEMTKEGINRYIFSAISHRFGIGISPF